MRQLAIWPAIWLAGCAPDLKVSTPARSAAEGSANVPPGHPGDASPATVTVDAGTHDAAPGPEVVDAPIKWSQARADLTLAYRRQHSDAAAVDLTIAPRVIVLHYTGGGSATGTRAYFDHLEIEADRAALRRAGRVNVSAHYVVDRDGTIYQLQPETRFARHCIGLNHIAIGIENVGDERKWPLTDAQVVANVQLVRAIAARHAITHLVGHHEVMSMRDHAYYVELDPSYRNSKSDPGARFMAAVRSQLTELALNGPS